jgi:hypothetical protein
VFNTWHESTFVMVYINLIFYMLFESTSVTSRLRYNCTEQVQLIPKVY